VTGVARLQALLDEGVATGVFPCASAVVLHEGRRVLATVAGETTLETVFDLASLTKPVATATVFLTLWRDGILAPETSVRQLAPAAEAGRAGATLGDLLTHRAGLPGFAPLFVPALRSMPALLEPGCPPGVRAAARAETVAHALAVAPEVRPGARALYSDVGFVVLGELLAAAAEAPLDALFVERVAGPLGLSVRFHRLSARQTWGSGGGALAGPFRGAVIAPTGRTRPREPAPGQEGLWEPFAPHPSPAGEVDDDNAWAMDGVAGHAGLFGAAPDLADLGQAILDDWGGAGRLAPPSCWTRALTRDAETPGSTRAFGFDTRRPGDSRPAGSAGHRLGDRPPGAVGHTGYTGTSLWVDLGRRLVVALCTNRTAGPRGRADLRINDFRPRFHDALVEALDPT
jgi:CubicO group peptidase (beta-lactamase class C family)